MLTNIQSVDPMRLGIEEGTSRDTWIFLAGGNRIIYGWTMGRKGDNSEDQVRKGKIRSRIEEGSVRRDRTVGHLKVGIEILTQWIFPKIYEGGPNEVS